MGRPLPLAFLVGMAAACGAVDFDFVPETDAGPPVVDSGVCVAPPVSEAGCLLGPSSCGAASEIETALLTEGVGCAPAGLGAAALWFQSAATVQAIDFYAWSVPPAGEVTPFDDGVTLSLFADDCATSPVGGDIDCPYRPWIFARGLSGDADVHLHVQSGPGAPLGIAYQVEASLGWASTLPPAGEAILCGGGGDGQHLDQRVDQSWPEWRDAPVRVDLDTHPPALDGRPWICGTAASGWRQVALALRNRGNEAMSLDGISLTGVDAPAEDLPFHFAFYRCGDDGEIGPARVPVARSCDPDPEASGKQFDAYMAVWNDEAPITEYVLILQVPPTSGNEASLSLSVVER